MGSLKILNGTVLQCRNLVGSAAGLFVIIMTHTILLKLLVYTECCMKPANVTLSLTKQFMHVNTVHDFCNVSECMALTIIEWVHFLMYVISTFSVDPKLQPNLYSPSNGGTDLFFMSCCFIFIDHCLLKYVAKCLSTFSHTHFVYLVIYFITL